MNESKSDITKLLLRGPEVADSLGISRALAYRWMQTGVLPVVRVNGSVRVPRMALLRWVESNTNTLPDVVGRESPHENGAVLTGAR